MPKSVAGRVRTRIAESAYTLTVYYPARVPGPTGTTPLAAAPVSPLIKAPAPTKPNELFVDAAREPITLPCLFTNTSVMSQARQESFKAQLGGWSLGVEALARVDSAEATREDGETIFVGCDHVSVDGKRYQVLQVVKMGSSVSKDGSYYVLLKGMARN